MQQRDRRVAALLAMTNWARVSGSARLTVKGSMLREWGVVQRQGRSIIQPSGGYSSKNVLSPSVRWWFDELTMSGLRRRMRTANYAGACE